MKLAYKRELSKQVPQEAHSKTVMVGGLQQFKEGKRGERWGRPDNVVSKTVHVSSIFNIQFYVPKMENVSSFQLSINHLQTSLCAKSERKTSVSFPKQNLSRPYLFSITQ